MSDEERSKVLEAHQKLTQRLHREAKLLGGEALETTESATTVRRREGKTITTDGPFAETREQLGGFYLIEAADLDEALSVAGEIPIGPDGAVEVRPVFPTPKP